MKGNFLPYKYAKMLKGLGFNEKCSSSYNTKGEIKQFDIYNSEVSNTELDESYKKHHWQHKEVSRPLWQQTEEWLWKKQSVIILTKNEQHKFYSIINNFGNWRIISKEFDSPITAHREGILKAIEYIHSQNK